jgi:hypothetical protein
VDGVATLYDYGRNFQEAGWAPDDSGILSAPKLGLIPKDLPSYVK